MASYIIKEADSGKLLLETSGALLLETSVATTATDDGGAAVAAAIYFQLLKQAREVT